MGSDKKRLKRRKRVRRAMNMSQNNKKAYRYLLEVMIDGE